MQVFIYHVKEHDFPDTVAFGDGWKKAKEKARELDAPIFRTVIKEYRDAYVQGGIFLTDYEGKHLLTGKEI